MRRLKKLINEIISIANANNIILTYPKIRAVKNRVNLLDYNIEETGLPHYNNNPYNLGDELGKVVIDWMLRKREGLSRDMWVKEKKFFLSIGSGILMSYQDATFWGTGVESERCYNSYRKYFRFFHTKYFRKLDIRAIRGPLSREIVMKLGHKCPDVYGDPAILMPMIYMPQSKKEHKYGIIPQFVTETSVREQFPNEFIISMNTDDYESVINKIVSCKKIITSSLHGIILAEAYGVPAVWYRGLIKDVDFKYKDYYYSTGRQNIPIITSIEEALSTEPLPIPDFAQLQQGLMQSFPYDLWEN